MSGIVITGYGVVSPAGWGIDAFRLALASNATLPARDLSRPGWTQPLRVRSVPTPSPRPPALTHARLRRASPISHYAVAAAVEALGSDADAVRNGVIKLGIVSCVMSGCVQYSRRFFDETLRDPATASPLVFPETVFNAPASHLAALFGSTSINYTLVGDPASYLQGIALAAAWLGDGTVDGCLVIGAEENDWLTSDAFRLFDRSLVLSEGAGALYLKSEEAASGSPTLDAVTDPTFFSSGAGAGAAAERVRSSLPPGTAGELVCDGLHGLAKLGAAEANAWENWPGQRLSIKRVLGEGLMAAAAWQCVAAIDALQSGTHSAACVNIVGCNRQAIAARFQAANTIASSP